jgi:type I restriction enzyme S subunit
MSVPKLRFPEFLDVGEWETRKLGELLLNHPDYGVNAPAVPYSKDLPAYLRITDISDEGYYLCDKKVSVNIKATDENYLSENDIVLARTGASVGKSYRYRKEDGKLVFAGFLIRIKPDPKKIDSTFLFNFISTKQYWNWVGVNSARSGQPGINGNEYATLPVPVPPCDKDGSALSEQLKIADCLSSIADCITLETHKLDTLKAHKKGLMQQLFPAEGETLPKLRFPEFQDLGEWEEKTIGNLLTIGNGKDYKHLSKGDIPVYGTGGYMLSVNDYLYDGESVCIGRKGTIDKPVLLSGKFWTVDTLFYTHSFKNCLPKFIYLCFQYINWLDYNAASGVPSLSKSTIENIALAIPSIPEQQKIADCLFSIDEAISLQSQAIDLLKLHKKGLMQQLFPSVEEVKR